MPRLFRGARPSPRHRLAAAAPHEITGSTPPVKLYKPATLSMWLNDTYGDCVTAEEAFAKACNDPEILISDAEVKAWATHFGVLDGADLTEVLDLMQKHGFIQDGKRYDDGPYKAVNWTAVPVLNNAIAQGPVKIGVAGDQLEKAWKENSGWFATGFHIDNNQDHCVSLCGYGRFGWLASQFGTQVPYGMDPKRPGVALYTWDSIGIIDHASLVAITGEAWVRSPTTVIV